MLLNALCNHMKRAAGQGANCINFERASMCVCMCVWEWAEDAWVQGGIITGLFNLLYSIFDEVNLIFLLACPVARKPGVAIVVKLLSDFPLEDSLSVSAHHCLSLGYRISWEEYNRTNTRVTHYLPNVTLEYRVTGLTALTTYTIEVGGMTSKGQGVLSSSTISSGVPPG